MPWVNIVSHYNDQAAEPGGAVTAFGGHATDGSTLEYSSPLGNETTIIWQSCSIDLIALQGADRDHVGNYGQSFPGEGTILRANYYSTIEPGFALRALSTGRPSMFQRYRYRMAPLMSPCEVYSAQPEAGLVLSHSSWGGLAVIPADLDTSWNWVEVDFTGREGEVGPYQDVIGVGALIRQSDSYIPEEGWVMEWQVWVEEDEPPEPEKKLPWWMCVPLPPKPPCPVRPPLTGFVPFDQYDADFKYPLKSSRVRAPLKVNPECIACGPDLGGGTDPVNPPVDPPVDPPEEVCLSAGSTGGQLFMYSDLPSWWQQAIDSGYLKITGSNWSKTFEWYGGEFVLFSSDGGEPPYNEEVKAVISFEGMSGPAQCIYYTHFGGA